ncbi:MAG: hypothetical protein KDE51_26470 [Anaerolineales bacterium]|nr:hypothetical protein [Anaerolineales bacterium]
MTPRHRDTTVSSADEAVMDEIRQAVKQIGKEAATHRFTAAEKKALAKVIFTYKQDHNLQTSENEVTRIAINFVLADYKQNGSKSILHKALLAVHD